MLLAAWNSGDLRRLRETLTQGGISADPGGWPVTGEDECERMEILATIADAMRGTGCGAVAMRRPRICRFR